MGLEGESGVLGDLPCICGGLLDSRNYGFTRFWPYAVLGIELSTENWSYTSL